MKEYDKLVRDRIPMIIEEDGKLCETEIVSDEMVLEYLYEKLIEETNELLESKNLEEMADVIEVIFAIAKKSGFDENILLMERKWKRERNGGFDNNIILKKVYDKCNK